ncbi:MAG: hypothetical protein ACE5JU_03235 [Candidatus Binatia bacterium]
MDKYGLTTFPGTYHVRPAPRPCLPHGRALDRARNAGAVLFSAVVKQDKEIRGVYLAHNSVLTRVVAMGDPTPLGGILIELSCMGLNGQGHVVFLGSARGKTARAPLNCDCPVQQMQRKVVESNSGLK